MITSEHRIETNQALLRRRRCTLLTMPIRIATFIRGLTELLQVATA